MFLGGSPGNQDDWFVPPAFLRKYWFLIPNHKPPNRLDNVVEIVVYLGQKLQEQMLVRKRMYFEREKYADHFPVPILASVEPEPSADDMKIEGIPENQEDANDDESEEGFVDFSEDTPLGKCCCIFFSMFPQEPVFTQTIRCCHWSHWVYASTYFTRHVAFLNWTFSHVIPPPFFTLSCCFFPSLFSHTCIHTRIYYILFIYIDCLLLPLRYLCTILFTFAPFPSSSAVTFSLISKGRKK